MTKPTTEMPEGLKAAKERLAGEVFATYPDTITCCGLSHDNEGWHIVVAFTKDVGFTKTEHEGFRVVLRPPMPRAVA